MKLIVSKNGQIMIHVAIIRLIIILLKHQKSSFCRAMALRVVSPWINRRNVSIRKGYYFFLQLENYVFPKLVSSFSQELEALMLFYLKIVLRLFYQVKIERFFYPSINMKVSLRLHQDNQAQL
jgi:hypothetical protein